MWTGMLLRQGIVELHPASRACFGSGGRVGEPHVLVEFLGLSRPIDRRGHRGRVRRPAEVAVVVDKVAFDVLLEDGTECPSVTVEITEVNFCQVRVESGQLLDKLRVRQMIAGRRFVRVPQHRADEFLRCRVLLLGGVQEARIGFFVVPHVPDVAVHDVRAGVDVAHHALARRDRVRELVVDGVPAFVLRDHRVWVRAETAIPELRVWPRMHRGAVVGVHDVARGATALGGSRRGCRWCPSCSASGRTNASCSGTHQYRVCPVACPQTTNGEPRPRAAGFFILLEEADFGPNRPPGSKMRSTPAPAGRFRNRGIGSRARGSTPFFSVFLGGGRRPRLEAQRCPVHAVGFAEHGLLHRQRAVVVTAARSRACTRLP